MSFYYSSSSLSPSVEGKLWVQQCNVAAILLMGSCKVTGGLDGVKFVRQGTFYQLFTRFLTIKLSFLPKNACLTLYAQTQFKIVVVITFLLELSALIKKNSMMQSKLCLLL